MTNHLVADAAYSGENAFVSSDHDTVLPQDRLTALRATTITKNVNEQVVTRATQQAIAATGSPTPPQAVIDQIAAQIRGNAGAMALITNGVTQAVDQGIAGANSTLGKGNTKVKVDTQNISMIFGFQPIANLNFYGGGVYQTIKGNVSLRGQAYSLYNGYDANIKETGGVGWLAGAAYQIPDIALKASVTYRSEIDHDVNINESIPTLGALALLGDDGVAAAKAIAAASGKTTITTPQSVNIDLQTGIMANTIAFANLRWVNWKDFSIQPLKFGKVSQAVGSIINRPNGFKPG